MIKKTLYFGNPAYLSLKDSQLVIKIPQVEKAEGLPEILKESSIVTKPIEDIGIVVLDNKQITLTTALIEALLDNNCAIITCDSKSMPVGMFLPLSGNKLQSERFRNQIDASVPLKKQLWQQTIQYKIRNQAAVIERCTSESNKPLLRMVDNVKSGDSENLEARAAAYYWKTLFGHIDGFIRDREGVPPNNLLNYGYAILRATVARSLVISGLLPTLGIHHHNKYNAYCLADDIMEPYRPFVDLHVYKLVQQYGENAELNRQLKAELLTIPTLDVTISDKRSPLMIAVGQTTASLAKCFNGEMRKIAYPVMK